MGKILYSYRMVADTGFAPNPYFGVLTLATCKPGMRSNKRIQHEIDSGNEVWIAGWSSSHINPAPTNRHELIWIGKVAEQISIADYWEQYPQKRAKAAELSANGCGCCKGASVGSVSQELEFYGDNIYRPCDEAEMGYEWQPNNFHEESDKAHDLSGRNVLICEEFYYFSGESPLLIPDELVVNIPKGQSRYGSLTEGDRANKFLEYAKAQPCLMYHLKPMQ